MNMYQVIFTMFLMFVTFCTGVPAPRRDRINYPDPDVRNRMNEQLGSLNLFMKGGGGDGQVQRAILLVEDDGITR